MTQIWNAFNESWKNENLQITCLESKVPPLLSSNPGVNEC